MIAPWSGTCSRSLNLSCSWTASRERVVLGLSLQLLQTSPAGELLPGACRAPRTTARSGGLCSSTRNSAKSPVLARSSGRTPMIWTGVVIDLAADSELQDPGRLHGRRHRRDLIAAAIS